VIVSYLPEPEQHPLWSAIKRLLDAASEGEFTFVPGELVWIAHEDGIVFGAGTAAPVDDHTAAILACGGTRHREWVEQAQAAVSAWARMNGATKLTMRGRKGWGRSLRPFGWAACGTEDGQTIFEKDLSLG